MKKNVEQQAKDFVIKFEKRNKRKPTVLSQGSGYDIKSNSRKIEVKGASSNKPPHISLNQFNIKALQKEKNFWLYIVYNIPAKPKLIILNRDEILSRANFIYEWSIPVRKKDRENSI